MKIEYECTIKHNGAGRSANAEYRINEIKNCCRQMRSLLYCEKGLLVLEAEACHREEFLGDGNAAVACLYIAESTWLISCCPFCAERIILHEVKRTNLYKRTTTRTITEDVWEERK